jgi:transcription antitermination protein NusB
MAHKHERSLSRRTAAQVLYAWEMRKSTADGKDITPDSMMGSGELDLIEGPMDDYALRLIHGVMDNLDEIDERLQGLSKNWALDRMSLVDLCIIRVATFEMLHCDDVPTAVAIDEAVELAKGFGGEESHKFVNGILGAIASEIQN